MRLFLCAALSAAVLLAVSGCGSDDGSGTSATAPAATAAGATASTPSNESTTTTRTAADKPPTKSEIRARHRAFLRRVNPICRDYNRDVRTVQSEIAAIGESGNVDVYVPPLKRAAAAARRASRRFNALTPPTTETADAALIGRALAAQARGNDLLLQAARADEVTDFAAANTALQQVVPKLQALMRQYGMTVCGAPK